MSSIENRPVGQPTLRPLPTSQQPPPLIEPTEPPVLPPDEPPSTAHRESTNTVDSTLGRAGSVQTNVIIDEHGAHLAHQTEPLTSLPPGFANMGFLENTSISKPRGITSEHSVLHLSPQELDTFQQEYQTKIQELFTDEKHKGSAVQKFGATTKLLYMAKHSQQLAKDPHAKVVLGSRIPLLEKQYQDLAQSPEVNTPLNKAKNELLTEKFGPHYQKQAQILQQQMTEPEYLQNLNTPQGRDQIAQDFKTLKFVDPKLAHEAQQKFSQRMQTMIDENPLELLAKLPPDNIKKAAEQLLQSEQKAGQEWVHSESNKTAETRTLEGFKSKIDWMEKLSDTGDKIDAIKEALPAEATNKVTKKALSALAILSTANTLNEKGVQALIGIEENDGTLARGQKLGAAAINATKTGLGIYKNFGGKGIDSLTGKKIGSAAIQGMPEETVKTWTEVGEQWGKMNGLSKGVAVAEGLNNGWSTLSDLNSAYDEWQVDDTVGMTSDLVSATSGAIGIAESAGLFTEGALLFSAAPALPYVAAAGFAAAAAKATLSESDLTGEVRKNLKLSGMNDAETAILSEYNKGASLSNTSKAHMINHLMDQHTDPWQEEAIADIIANTKDEQLPELLSYLDMGIVASEMENKGAYHKIDQRLQARMSTLSESKAKLENDLLLLQQNLDQLSPEETEAYGADLNNQINDTKRLLSQLDTASKAFNQQYKAFSSEMEREKQATEETELKSKLVSVLNSGLTMTPRGRLEIQKLLAEASPESRQNLLSETASSRLRLTPQQQSQLKRIIGNTEYQALLNLK